MSLRTLISKDSIDARNRELAKEIMRDFEGHDLIVLCVLKGAVLFLTDLIRAMDRDLAIDFIQVSSYGNDKKSYLTAMMREIDWEVIEDRVQRVDALKKVLG